MVEVLSPICSTSDEYRSAYPNLQSLVDSVVTRWPQHGPYLAKSLRSRNRSLLRTSDRLAAAVLELAEPNYDDYVGDYHWLCEQISEQELYFARNDRYMYSKFSETFEHVYSNTKYMKRYMNGLLYSQVLWYMHASSLHYFSQRVSSRVKEGGRVLEVGSGHGLLLFLALRDLGMSEAVAWDLSPVSLEQTKRALGKLGALDRARFEIQDMGKVDDVDDRFDLIILSHLLEHLEKPVEALCKIRRLLKKGGLIFINVPLNAPMPDHLILLRTPYEADQLLIDAGFQVVETATHTTQAVSLSRALRTKTAVTCSIIAEAG